MVELTTQQAAIVAHPRGSHALVLAVAGSGKTSTLVWRLRHLVMDKQVPPSKIQVLMFNSLARKQFQERLQGVGDPRLARASVNTFHSFTYGLIRQLIAKGMLPHATVFWSDDTSERARIVLHQVIGRLERDGTLIQDEIDIAEAMLAISLWKGSLIPPDRAGYRGNPKMPRVYLEFEKARVAEHAISYDDFVPIVVDFMSASNG